MKRSFEDMVKEHTEWLYAFIKRRMSNSAISEDILQEVWLRAYRAYGDYVECGKPRAWLCCIAQNHIASYYKKNRDRYIFSLDGGEEDESFYEFLPGDSSPEEEIVRKEQIDRMLSLLRRLPEGQKKVLTYRYLYGMSVKETAECMSIPEGSVKSKTHDAIGRLQKQLGVFSQETKNKQGDNIMECRIVYKYLFIYAMGKLNDKIKGMIEAHLAECESCRRISDALCQLYPEMTFAPDDEIGHYLISFPEIGLAYLGSSCHIDNYDMINRKLEEGGGIVPEDIQICNWGFNGNAEDLLACFDRDGNEIEFVAWKTEDGHVRVRQTKLSKVSPTFWSHDVMLYSNIDPCAKVEKSIDAPNLYYGERVNWFGRDVKSALYQAVPGEATNIRIKRGNGVIDCGSYFFPYADRYLTEDEGHHLKYSYNL